MVQPVETGLKRTSAEDIRRRFGTDVQPSQPQEALPVDSGVTAQAPVRERSEEVQAILDKYGKGLERAQQNVQEAAAIQQSKPALQRGAEYLARITTQTQSRVAEGVLGALGNAQSLLNDFLLFGAETLAGEELPKLRQMVTGTGALTGADLPTSGELRKASEEVTGGFTAPQNKAEEFLNDVVEDIAAFSLPGTGQFKMATNIGIPLLGNLAQEGVKFGGGSPAQQESAKLGTMVATTLMGLVNPRKYGNSLLKESVTKRPENATVPVASIIDSLFPVYEDLQKGTSTPSKAKSLEVIEDVFAKGSKGEILLSELEEFQRNINELTQATKTSDLDKHAKLKALRNLTRTKRGVIEAIEDYGATNPEYLALRRAGNEALAVYHESNHVSNFVAKHFPVFKSQGGATLFHLAEAVAGGASTIASAGTYQGYKVLEQVTKSPALRKHYVEAVQAALKQNSVKMVTSLEKLDQQLVIEERRERQRERQKEERRARLGI